MSAPSFVTALRKQLASMTDRAVIGTASAALAEATRRQLFTTEEQGALEDVARALRDGLAEQKALEDAAAAKRRQAELQLPLDLEPQP